MGRIERDRRTGIPFPFIRKIVFGCVPGGIFNLTSPEMVEYMDLAPNQIVSASAALIPFLEKYAASGKHRIAVGNHEDAKRNLDSHQ